jgi:hypothetical protein
MRIFVNERHGAAPDHPKKLEKLPQLPIPDTNRLKT